MAYCIAIQKELLVSVCPLGVGQCLWQHRTTHHCKYTERELTTEEFSTLVNAPAYTQDFDQVKQQIALEVQKQ